MMRPRSTLRLVRRIANFPTKTKQQKLSSYVYRWLRWFRGAPPPVRLPFGAWWLFEADFLGESLLGSGYEESECNFEMCFVKPGMVVLDIGAHQGFHTLLLSKIVGRGGRVLSFEPSPSSFKRLELHLKVNWRRNVKTFECALGETDGTATLYTVPANSVLNCLRPPATTLQSSPIPVIVKKLDDVLSHERIRNVDFVKLDVEGGELAVLKGAERMLSTVPRPVILCEVLEDRTRGWGYPARLIVERLSERGFIWFELNEKAELVRLAPEQSEFRANLVAVPRESLSAVGTLCVSAHYAEHQGRQGK